MLAYTARKRGGRHDPHHRHPPDVKEKRVMVSHHPVDRSGPPEPHLA